MTRRVRAFADGIILGLLGMALALRLLARPGFAAPPEPGLVALCGGGQIVWIAPGEDPSEPGRAADACPWMGLSTLAEGTPPPALPGLAARPETAIPPLAGRLPATAAPGGYRARAPPGA